MTAIPTEPPDGVSVLVTHGGGVYRLPYIRNDAVAEGTTFRWFPRDAPAEPIDGMEWADVIASTYQRPPTVELVVPLDADTEPVMISIPLDVYDETTAARYLAELGEKRALVDLAKAQARVTELTQELAQERADHSETTNRAELLGDELRAVYAERDQARREARAGTWLPQVTVHPPARDDLDETDMTEDEFDAAMANGEPATLTGPHALVGELAAILGCAPVDLVDTATKLVDQRDDAMRRLEDARATKDDYAEGWRETGREKAHLTALLTGDRR